VSVRVPTTADAEALAALMNARSQALHGTADFATETLVSWFQAPDIEMLVAEGPAGLEAYADLYAGSDEWAWLDPREHPGHAGAVAPLLERFEARAAELGRTGMRAFVPEQDGTTRGLVEARGYQPIRFQFRMLVEHETEPPPPEFPPGLEPTTFRAGDERAVHATQMDAFADHWGFTFEPFDAWRTWNLERDTARPDLWWLVRDGDELAAVCLNRMGDSGESDHGYVHILGVRPDWRRRGLGEALLRHSFREFWQRGVSTVSLDVDGENTTGAIRLYERVGMHVDRRTDLYELRL
jgi:ribosomal protein S18 acetylase RimI-like enzyme